MSPAAEMANDASENGLKAVGNEAVIADAPADYGC